MTLETSGQPNNNQSGQDPCDVRQSTCHSRAISEICSRIFPEIIVTAPPPGPLPVLSTYDSAEITARFTELVEVVLEEAVAAESVRQFR